MPTRPFAARLIVAALSFATVFASLQCARVARRPNLLLLVVDTLRADHLGCYGYKRNTSPAIDRLAAEGIRFDNAFTTAPWTLPAVASLMTSTLPWEHGAVNDFLAFRRDLPTLAEVLAGAGYETAAFVSHIYTSRAYGFDRGFDRFEDFRITEEYAFDRGKEPRADRVIGEAIRWLSGRAGDRPFFLWIHLFDPHWEYGAPEPYRAMFDRPYDGAADGTYASIARYLSPDTLLAEDDLRHVEALYDGEIRYTDAWIDTLFHYLKGESLWKETAIVVTADHGEEFQEHRSMGHSFTFYDEVLRVPLVVKEEGPAAGGATTGRLVSLVDLFPTLAERAGASPPARLGGTPLGARGGEERTLLAGTIRGGRYGRAALRGTGKLVWDRSGLRFFDRALDPGETTGAPPDGATAAALLPELFGESEELGWHVAWPATPGRAHAYEGTVDPSGLVVEVLPGRRADISIEAEGNGSFRFRAATDRAGGIRFRVVPPDAPVAFHLRIDGADREERIEIGRGPFHPPDASFGLDPSASPAGSLDRPASLDAPGPRCFLWKEPEPPAPPRITLGAGERRRLRALGYLE